jgi:hypothetical protein
MYFYGTVLMGMEPDRFWHMPIGLFLDLWTCFKQWQGIEKAKATASIDDVIPIF